MLKLVELNLSVDRTRASSVLVERGGGGGALLYYLEKDVNVKAQPLDFWRACLRL